MADQHEVDLGISSEDIAAIEQALYEAREPEQEPSTPERNQLRDNAYVAIENRYREARFRSAERALKLYRRPEPLRRDPRDLLGRYLEEINQYPLLSKADERILFAPIDLGVVAFMDWQETGRRTDAHDQAFSDYMVAYNKIFYSNLRLSISVAKSYKVLFSPSLDLLDAASEGNIGLMTAVRRFDVSRGNKFSTFAVPWIRQAITRKGAEQARTIRLPNHIQDEWLALRRATRELEAAHNHDITDTEVAAKLGWKRERVEEIRRVGAIAIPSLNAQTGEEGEGEFGDFVAVDAAPSVADQVVDGVINEELVAQIFVTEGLTTRDKIILSLRYGMYVPQLSGEVIISKHDGTKVVYDEFVQQRRRNFKQAHEHMTLEDIGVLFGITREYVRQLQARAERIIRAAHDNPL